MFQLSRSQSINRNSQPRKVAGVTLPMKVSVEARTIGGVEEEEWSVVGGLWSVEEFEEEWSVVGGRLSVEEFEEEWSVVRCRLSVKEEEARAAVWRSMRWRSARCVAAVPLLRARQ
jgi:hypothetical protein